MAALSTEQENYVRLSLLLTGVSPKAVRRLFDREFTPVCLTKSIRKENRKIRNLCYEKHINKEQWKTLQGSQLESTSFDISLMICLLRNLTNIQGPRTGYDVLSLPTDQCEGADLARFKYYRNVIAHMTDDKIDTAYFKTAADDICGAIERLGRSSLKAECEQRRHGPLDQSNIDIAREIRSSKIENEEALGDIKDLKEEIQELKERSDKTDAKQNKLNSAAPVRGFSLKDKDESTNFVQTVSFNEIVNAIKSNQCVIVTGPPGCGKFMNCLHAAALLKQSESGRYDYKFGLDIGDFFDIESIYSLYAMTNRAYSTKVYILDEFFGKCSLNECNYILWKDLIHKIKRILRTNRKKIVLTCRSVMYETVIKDNLGILAYHCSVSYSQEEINKIYKSYVGTSENLSLPSDPSLLALIPALCLFSDCELLLKNIRTDETVTTFICSEMKRLEKDSIWDYRALVLLCMMNNHVDDTIFQKITHSHDNLLRKLFLESGERVSSIKEKIERSLSSLEGKFTKYCNSEYTFAHDWLFDYVAHFIGTENVELVIDSSNSAFLTDKVIFQPMLSSKEEIYNLSIYISHDLKEAYESRLLQDLKRGYLWNVISSCHSRLQEFEKISQWFKDCGNKIKYKSDKSTALHIASYYGCTDLVKILIEVDKKQINATSSNQKTPLYHACSMGYTATVKLLIINNPLVDVDTKEPSHWTDTNALYIACANQHCEVVKLLLSYMKIKNCTTGTINSPLHVACENGNTEIVQLLIKSNVNVNHVVGSLSPLHYASFNGHIDIVQMLIANNASVNADRMSITPLCMAASNGHKEIVNILIQNFAAVNTSVDNALTPIFAAARNGHAEIVEMLLKYKALIETKYNGITVLGVACSELHENVIDILLKHGADIEHCDGELSALHFVCKGSSLKDKQYVVKKLLKRNININKWSIEDKTPLDYVLNYSDLEVAQLLIKNGATANHTDNLGHFPLLTAARRGQKVVVEFLLKQNAIVDWQNSEGNTTLNYLCSLWPECSKYHPISDLSDSGKQCFIDIINLLLQKQADVNKCNKNGYSLVTSACKAGKTYCIQLLLDHDLGLVNQVDGNGKTPLYIACLNNQKLVVDCLLKYNVNINQQCSFSETALHAILFSYEDQNELLNELLNRGADVNLTNEDKNSVLHIVCEKNNITCAGMLLQKNPQLNMKNLAGYTPLHSACVKGYRDMVACLLNHLTNINKVQNPQDPDGNDDNKPSNTRCDINSIINESDNNGHTPLHIACINGNSSIAELLLRAGADVNKLDRNNRTPLYLAYQPKYNTNKDVVVELLLQHHANIN